MVILPPLGVIRDVMLVDCHTYVIMHPQFCCNVIFSTIMYPLFHHSRLCRCHVGVVVAVCRRSPQC